MGRCGFIFHQKHGTLDQHERVLTSIFLDQSYMKTVRVQEPVSKKGARISLELVKATSTLV